MADLGVKARWDRGTVVRAALAAAAVLVAFSGCGALMPGALTDRSTADGAPAPGVTADAVKVVFVGVDLAATSKLTGFTTVPAGDPAAQVAALATYVNAHGGIAGRRLDAVFRSYEASDDSPAAEEKLCNQITQDDRAFAVVLTGQFQANARPCYAQRRTLVLDATLIGTDEATYRQLAPYLWAPSFPSYDDFVTAFVGSLAGQGFFDGTTQAGVVAADTPVNRAAYKALAEPALGKAGVRPRVAWIDTTDLGTLNAGLNQAAVDFRAQGIERVLFLGGARLASFFLTAAAAQGFTARYGVSSFDNPSFLVNNPATIPAEALRGMLGIGFNPSQDVPDKAYAFPATDAERTCVDLFAAAGQKFAARENARVAFTYCDAALLLQKAAAGLTTLDAAGFARAAAGLGTGFQPAAGFAGLLTAERHAAADGYRVLAYDDGCACFGYRGPEVKFAH